MRVAIIEGPPMSKARPRFRQDGRVYASSEQVAAEEAMAVQLKQYIEAPIEGNVAVGCIFFRPNKQRIDVDNMLKHVMDSANGILWHDDSQVTALAGSVELDRERPRTVIVIGDHQTSMTRVGKLFKTFTCLECGSLFESKQHKPKYCCRDCWTAATKRMKMEPKRCLACGTTFQPRVKAQKFCSESCRRAGVRMYQKKTNVCRDCGGPVSRPEYIRCRSCWRESRKRKQDK